MISALDGAGRKKKRRKIAVRIFAKIVILDSPVVALVHQGKINMQMNRRER